MRAVARVDDVGEQRDIAPEPIDPGARPAQDRSTQFEQPIRAEQPRRADIRRSGEDADAEQRRDMAAGEFDGVGFARVCERDVERRERREAAERAHLGPVGGAHHRRQPRRVARLRRTHPIGGRPPAAHGIGHDQSP